MAHPKHEAVRRRFHRCCGYCGVSETDAGGALTIDHFCPLSANGDDSDDNLIYACFRCNSYKGEWQPTAEDAEHGRRLLHPVLDAVDQHLRENAESGLLEPLSAAGRFHIALLRLNRPELVEFRRQRRLRRLLLEAVELLQDENRLLKLRINNLEQYVEQLKLRGQAEQTP